jgi:hypothetical protein
VAGGCTDDGPADIPDCAAPSHVRPAATAPGAPVVIRARPDRTREDRVAQCFVAAPDLGRLIASGHRQGIQINPGRAMAVKSPDLDGLYFVSVQVQVSVTEPVGRRRDADEPLLGLPVWAISESAWLTGDGLIMTANRNARRMTSWPDAHDHSPQITDTNHNVGEAAACQLI